MYGRSSRSELNTALFTRVVKHGPAIDAQAVDEYRDYKVRESEARRRAAERRKPLRNEHGQVLRPLLPPRSTRRSTSCRRSSRSPSTTST